MGTISGIQELFILGMLAFLAGIYLMVRWWFSA